jgi:hypothetical protein
MRLLCWTTNAYVMVVLINYNYEWAHDLFCIHARVVIKYKLSVRRPERPHSGPWVQMGLRWVQLGAMWVPNASQIGAQIGAMWVPNASQDGYNWAPCGSPAKMHPCTAAVLLLLLWWGGGWGGVRGCMECTGAG